MLFLELDCSLRLYVLFFTSPLETANRGPFSVDQKFPIHEFLTE